MAYALTCSSLLLVKRTSPAAYREGLRTLGGAPPSFRQPNTEQVIRFVDLAAAVVREALKKKQKGSQAESQAEAQGHTR